MMLVYFNFIDGRSIIVGAHSKRENYGPKTMANLRKKQGNCFGSLK